MESTNGNGNGSKFVAGLKTSGIAGTVVFALASLGYAEIQRSENGILLNNNTFLVEMVQKEAVECRTQIILAYSRGVNADTGAEIKKGMVNETRIGDDKLRRVDDQLRRVDDKLRTKQDDIRKSDDGIRRGDDRKRKEQDVERYKEFRR